MSESRRAKKRRASRIRLGIVAVLIVGALVGAYLFKQHSAVDVDELLARVETQFEAGEYQAAIIDLKTVVSEQPNNRAARFRLGQIYLDVGAPKGALKEFERARELGMSQTEVSLGITRALLLTGKSDEAATEIAINGDSENPDWLVLRGMLDLSQQRLDDARATFKEVLAEHPEHEQARRGLMQAELAAGNAELARKEIETLIDGARPDAGLWIIKGELDMYDQKFADAQKSFATALEIAPTNPIAHIGAARALLALGQVEQASNQLDSMESVAAEDPRVNFLRAKIAEQRDDIAAALHALRAVLQVAPMHRESLVLAAKLHFSRGEFVRAQDYVGRLLEIEPRNEAAQRMLGAIQLAAGRVEGLDVASSDAPDTASIQDPGMLALLGTAYLKHGRYADSQNSLQRAADLAPDSLPIRTQLALSRLSAGKPDEAVAELNAILEQDPEFVQAEIMLALVHMARRDNEAALGVAGHLVGQQPDSALAHNVYGYVLEVAGDKEAAVAEFNKALARDPAFHPARINLARLAIAAGDRAAGRKHFEAVLAIEPFQVFALLGLAALALQDDQLDEAERLWSLARKHNPDAVAPRLLLAKHYRAKKNGALAQTVIKEAYRLAPFAVQVQAEYAAIMLEAGELDEALRAAQLLVERVPDSVAGLELLASVQNRLGDAGGLTGTLEKIAEIAPDAIGARVLLGRLAIRRKDYDGADMIARTMLENSEHSAAAHELKGDIALARNDLEGAKAAYLRAFEATPNSNNVLKLDQVERRLGQSSGRLDAWLAAHPDDLQVRLTRASYMQQEGTGSGAIPEYERLLKTAGNNPIVLNNLAWLYHEGGDQRALELARKAHELAPSSAEIMDTYGWILFRSGQQEQGLTMLEQAQKAAPNNPDIQYHNASALHATGDNAAARRKLEAALTEHKTFYLRAEAEALLQKLAPAP